MFAVSCKHTPRAALCESLRIRIELEKLEARVYVRARKHAKLRCPLGTELNSGTESRTSSYGHHTLLYISMSNLHIIHPRFPYLTHVLV